MKKLLFCTLSLKTGGGGIASYAQEFIKTLKYDYHFTVVTGDDGKVEDGHIRTLTIKYDDWSNENIERILNIIQEECPDIIVNSSFPLLSIATPFLPNDIKVITISHFTDGKLAKQAGLNANYVDAVIGLSTFAKSYLEKYSGVQNKDKVKVVYNFMPAIATEDVITKQKSDVLNIVYPGGSIYEKSADVVAKAVLKLLKTDLDFNLYWIGKASIVGNRWPIVTTKSLHNILPDDSRIKQLGRVPRELSQRLLANANVFILPSRGEGFPISLIEAMRGRCIPIISDAKHGALDLIEDGVNGFVIHQGDSEELYQRLVYIINNHDKLFSIYNESYKTFCKHLHEDVWVKKMRAILECDNCHVKRKRYTPTDKLICIGRRKMKEAEWQYWLFDRFIKQPSMMIKYRYYRYVYRYLI